MPNPIYTLKDDREVEIEWWLEYPGDPGSLGIHRQRTGDLIDPGHPPSPPEFGYNIYDLDTGEEIPEVSFQDHKSILDLIEETAREPHD